MAEIGFIVDAMLGSLARWLRLLGFNTLYCETQTDDEILKQIHERILLTRDKELLTRALNRGFRVVNPGHGPIRLMLQRLEEEVGVEFIADPNKSRCAKCNSKLSPRNRSQVESQVPLGSLHNHDRFWQCLNSQCQKVYWQGRHWTRIKNTLKKMASKNTET